MTTSVFILVDLCGFQKYVVFKPHKEPEDKYLGSTFSITQRKLSIEAGHR